MLPFFTGFVTFTLLLWGMAAWHGMEVGTGGEAAWLSHFSYGLFSCFTALFVHCMTMFYFIGTGKSIKEAAHLHPGTFDEEARESRRFKFVVSPWSTYGIAALLVMTTSGGIAFSGETPTWFPIPPSAHPWVVIGGVLVNLWAFWKEGSSIVRNTILLRKVDLRLRRINGDAGTAGRGDSETRGRGEIATSEIVDRGPRTED